MQFQTPKAAKPRGYGLCSPASHSKHALTNDEIGKSARPVAYLSQNFGKDFLRHVFGIRFV